jgi:hypothetical protein
MEVEISIKKKGKFREPNYESERRVLKLDERSVNEENINNNNPISSINRSKLSDVHENSVSIENDYLSSIQQQKIDSMINLIKTIRQEHLKKEERDKHVFEAKKKILKISKLLRTKNLFLKAIINDKNDDMNSIFLHPELSNFRLFVDSIIIGVILYDSFNAPYKFLVEEDIYPITKEVIIDCFLTFDIISNFFTAFFLNHVLITDFKLIFLNYIKFNFWVDVLYVLPFWLFQSSLYWMRMIKLYKFFKILKRIRYLLVKIFSYCIKSLKLIHSVTNILIFSISLIYILHYMACIFVYIGSLSEQGWHQKNQNGNLASIETKTDIYIASLYLLMETFTTIGYGDINPKTTTEVIFLMIGEVVNVGLFAYLISCIMDIILRMSTDEISFKIKSDVDINSWLLKYNNKLPKDSKMKLETKEEDKELFEEVKKYFQLFHKNDYLWVKNFDFLDQMRPDIRKELLNHSFNSLFNTFSFFFNQLEDNFKFKIALNLKSKIIEIGEEIISEDTSSRKNKFKYIYLIGKGCVLVKKNQRAICRFDSGSYFGDEYLLTNSANFSYINISDKSREMYLFCCPIHVVNEICSYYEESYVMMLIKTLYRFIRIRELAEKNGIIFNDINSKFFKKLMKPRIPKEKRSVTKIFEVNEEKIFDEIIYENIDDKDKQSEVQNIELESKKDQNINQAENTEDLKSNHNQIFSMDESSKIQKNAENLSIQGIHLEEQEILKENNFLKLEKEVEEELFDNLDFLDKIELNEENIGGMMNLNNKAEKLNEHKEYLTKLVKKLNFINHQVDFVIDHYKTIEKKSNDMIEIFDSNDSKFFN